MCACICTNTSISPPRRQCTMNSEYSLTHARAFSPGCTRGEPGASIDHRAIDRDNSAAFCFIVYYAVLYLVVHRSFASASIECRVALHQCQAKMKMKNTPNWAVRCRRAVCYIDSSRTAKLRKIDTSSHERKKNMIPLSLRQLFLTAAQKTEIELARERKKNFHFWTLHETWCRYRRYSGTQICSFAYQVQHSHQASNVNANDTKTKYVCINGWMVGWMEERDEDERTKNATENNEINTSYGIILQLYVCVCVRECLSAL